MEIRIERASCKPIVDGWRYAIVSKDKPDHVYSWATVKFCGIMITISWYTSLLGGE